MKNVYTLLLLVFFCVSFAQEIVVSPSPGVHAGLREITFTIPNSIKAHYTTGGKYPSRRSARLPEKISVSKNTVLRIASYDQENKRKDTSFSFFIEQDHELPVVSIITEPENFFDYNRGIYVKGCCADSIDPYEGANFWKNWERKINVTFFEPDGTVGFSQDAGVKIFGGYSVGRPQKSLAIIARKAYGNNRFEYPIFPNLKIDEYKSFLLRNAGSDMQEAHVRDVFATQLVKNTGIDIQEYRPAVTYINGEYWGIYNMREKINEHYINAHYDIDKDSLIIMRHRNDRQHGSVKPYRNLISYLSRNRLTNKESLDYVSNKMDVDNYILYNICETYTANGDAGGNIRYFKGVNPDTKWRWVFYDLDMGLNISNNRQYKQNTIHDFTKVSGEIWPNPAWSTLIIRKILENDSLKHLYINQFSDLLNTNFSVEYASKTLDRLLKDVESEIDAHLKRWRISRTRYDSSVENIRLFIKERPTYLRKYLREQFLLESAVDVKVIVKSNEGKCVLNTLNLEDTFTGKYYKNIPIKLKAKPKFDYDFLGWKNMYNKEENLYYNLKESTIFEPIFKVREASIYKDSILISEINCSQADKNDWIEIYNCSQNSINISGFIIKDERDEHHFVFPENTILLPNTFLILTEDREKFLSEYNKNILLVDGLDFGFNSKDLVRFYDNEKKPIHKIDLGEFENSKTNFNLALTDLRSADSPYILEIETPGSASLSYAKILKEEERDAFYKRLFFYIGISSLLLSILLFLFFFRRKTKK